MRAAWTVAAGLLLTGCVQPPVVLDPGSGYRPLPFAGTFECDGQPVAVTGNHKDVTLRTGCRRVLVAGSHDDLVAYVEPGATIEVVGSHNTVVYRLVRRGPPPQWIDRGLGNELIRNSVAGWERDHDWYQEQH